MAGRAGKCKRRAGWLLTALVVCAGMSKPAQEIRALPENVRMTQGGSVHLALTLPVRAEADGGAVRVSQTADIVEKSGPGVDISADMPGEAQVTLRLMGIVPVKIMSVSVAQEKMLIPGGRLIGVAMQTKGVLLVGTSDVGGVASPAREAGLRSGDHLLRADGQEISSAQQLSEVVARSGGKTVHLDVQRADACLEYDVRPKRDARDGEWRLGAWVRQTTAGVGTLSFVDPATGMFGALGHSVSDIDTKTRLLLGKGDIYEGTVADIHRGKTGSPGEIVGSFFDGEEYLGEITKNTDCGVFGVYAAGCFGEAVPVMRRSEVQTGPAQIYSQIGNDGVRAYNCEITRVSRSDEPAQRSLVIRITDEKLLSKTGGIVQGMSGSPILQDGKLVGAVTHVLVNDPTRGYGIFIENMLDAAG